MLVLSSPASPAHPPGVTSRALASTSTTLYPLRPHLPLRRRLLLVPVLSARSRFWAGTVVWFAQAVSGAGRVISLGELTPRDHSPTSTFKHTRRLYQGHSLPHPNAVLPVASERPLPANYHQAWCGLTTFLFRLPLPRSPLRQ
ncbi:hypothetical protein H4582DRAFT_1979556 [Lactarius indigo]|nr:hypothetical protein H4582DRAFT_1979556 [Lactarius indigo]